MRGQYGIKQVLRAPMRTVLFILLLTLAGAALCMGVGLWATALKSLQVTDNKYTTIAVPNFASLNGIAGLSSAADALESSNYTNSKYYNSLYNAYQKRDVLYNNVKQAGKGSTVSRPDSRRAMSAYANGLTSLFPMFATVTHPKEFTVFAVTCTDIRYKDDIDYMYDESGSQVEREYRVEYLALRVDEVLAAHETAETHEWILGYIMEYDPDIGLSKVFETGKQYIIAGMYYPRDDNGYLVDDNGHLYTGLEKADAVYQEEMLESDFNSVYRYYIGWLGNRQFYGDENELDSFYETTRVEYAGDIHEFLTSEAGEYGRMLIEAGEIAAHSIDVLTTGNLDTIFFFNDYRASICEGRAFTRQEYAGGNQVCIVNQDYAKINGLSVGDELTLRFFNNGYLRWQCHPSILGIALHPMVYIPGTPLTDEISYEIVGFYSSSVSSKTDFFFTQDTIFIPDKAVQQIPELEDASLYNSLVNTYAFTMANKDAPKFMEEMEPQEYGNLFVIYDQGYSSVIGAVKAFMDNSILILSLCAAGWLVVMGFFLFVFVRRRSKDVGIMLSLGTGRKRAARSLVSGCMAVALLATALGGIVGNSLLGSLTDTMVAVSEKQETRDNAFSNLPIQTAKVSDKEKAALIRESFSLPYSWAVITGVCVMQIIVIGLGAWWFAYGLTKKNPMLLTKEGNGG